MRSSIWLSAGLQAVALATLIACAPMRSSDQACRDAKSVPSLEFSLRTADGGNRFADPKMVIRQFEGTGVGRTAYDHDTGNLRFKMEPVQVCAEGVKVRLEGLQPADVWLPWGKEVFLKGDASAPNYVAVIARRPTGL